VISKTHVLTGERKLNMLVFSLINN